jgi:hypothetical protein
MNENLKRRIEFIKEKLVGRGGVQIQLLGPGRPENCELYVPLPEYGVCLFVLENFLEQYKKPEEPEQD